MSATLKLQPASAKLSDTKAISFKLTGLLSDQLQRVSFENITHNLDCRVNGSSQHVAIKPGTDEVSGTVDLNISEDSETEVVSIYANIEQQNGDSWSLRDIAAFAFQVQLPKRSSSNGDKVIVSPPFVGPEDQAVIEVETDPNSRIKVWINGRGFIVRSNSKGYGTMHIRGIDLMSGSPFSAGSMNKFPITFSKNDDGFKQLYEAGTSVHYVPETMRVLQATNEPDAPECAILDPDPLPGLRLRTLDDFCFDGAVVGEPTIFDSESGYVNSRIGFCGPITEASVAPVTENGICRIFNSLDSTLLPNGTGLVAFSSAFDPSVDADLTTVPTLASRIYVAHAPSTLKFDGNPVRTGTILEPPQFYHSFTLEEDGSEGFIGLIFRLSTGEFTEIRYEHGVDSGSIISTLVSRIRESELLVDNDIEVFTTGNRIDVFSENRFSIRSNSTGNAVASVQLNSNKTLEILVSNDATLDDAGSTIVFLNPQLGSQTYGVVGRTVPSILRIEVPEGVNNGIGPRVAETLYCQEFVIVSSSSPSDEGLSNVNPLPYIKDPFQRELPAVNPTIAAVPDRVNGSSYCYAVCQAPVNGVYQLFYFGFSLGNVDSDLEWKQITFEGENKNARAECDSMGNLHLVWESDRNGGPTQIYYSILGPGSKIVSNQVFVSALEKQQLRDDFASSLVRFTQPAALQTGWTRFLTGTAGCSLSGSSTVGIEGSPADGAAMAVYRLDKDQSDVEFDGLFSQLSYQVSFDLSVTSLNDTAYPRLDGSDIDKRFRDFKSQFSKSVNDTYVKNLNVFTLDRYDAFYDKIIPVVGAYKFGDFSGSSESGGTDARHVTHTEAAEFVSAEDVDAVVANSGRNLNHFMIALMPEKIRFKALNVDPLFGYLERNELTSESADTYIREIEEVVYTGRYKFALVLATSEDESTGDAANKKYHLLRQFGDPIDFEEAKNVKVAIHYSKANQDYIDGRLAINPYASEQNSRFHGDIIVTVDNEVKLGENFIADFSDQYRAFDIGLGWPDNNVFLTQEQLPFNGNEYDDRPLLLKYENAAIGPHSIQANTAYINLSAHDRTTAQMVVPETINDILLNGDFESNTLPVQASVSLVPGDESIAPWVIGNEIGVGYAPAGSVSFIGDYSVGLTGVDDSNLGFIEQTLATEVGEEYSISFVLSSNPDASQALGVDVTRKVRVTAAAADETFETTIRVGETEPNWATYVVKFTASSTSTTIRFQNASDSQSPFKDFAPIIDAVRVYQVSRIPNELVSQNANDEILVSSDEYAINFQLSTFGDITRLPITLSTENQNRNPDLAVDAMGKAHAVWQSNRDEYWEIYYAGMRDRSTPFRFETRITNSTGNSLEPSIGVDKKGRRVVAWHDNRRGRYHQIYAALNNIEDPMYINQCRIDEANEFRYQREEDLDPYDPYLDSVPDALTCGVEFSFEAETSGTFYFVLNFYSDRNKTMLAESIDSRESILGWKVNGAQMNADGIFVPVGETISVSYTVSDDDGLDDRIYYVDVVYESVEVNEADVVSFEDAVSLTPPFGTSIEAGDYENDSVIFFKESLKEAEFTQVALNASDILDTIDQSESTPDFAIGGSGILQGFEEGEIVASYYLQYDPTTSVGTGDFSITFEGPILAIYAGNSSLSETNPTLGRDDITYATDASTGGLDSETDVLRISADRRTISGTMAVSGNLIDSIRVVVAPLAEVSGSSDFVYHCPFEQSPRCAIETDYFNNNDLTQNDLHFRISFFADSDMESTIYSAFTLFDTDGWVFGPNGFPADGVDVTENDTITIGFDPEVLPFEKFEDQGAQDNRRSISSFFTFGADDWQIEDAAGTVQATWENDNGNGALSYVDSLPSDAWFIAPPKFSGDLEGHYGGKLEISMRLDVGYNPSVGSQNLIVDLEANGGATLRYTATSKPDRNSSYTQFSLPLQSGTSNWTYEPAGGGGFSVATETDFRAVLADLETIRIAADFYSEADKSYLSSVVVSPANANANPVFKKPLLCGVNYYYKIERFYEGAFTTIREGSFLCPCSQTDADIWREDKDSMSWLCSGQGFDDYRITQTDREAINARVDAARNDLFYISWQDYRFTRMQSDQPALSPDYFFGVYNAAEDKFYSSAQGSYDRRMTYFAESTDADQPDLTNLVLHDATVFIDPFQNINTAFHDGTKVYHQGCSIGCAYEAFNPDLIVPCMFTDGTDETFYYVTAGPERNIEQYQKMRVRDEYVVYSTYLDIDSPIPVINDCFIELDIIGVPGTYAYRLKNEEDDDFTEWLPIGPDLPEQRTDADGTAAERDFFRGYFISKDRFIAPWIASEGNGTKRVCCEILTYFGKTEQFCIEFQAIYKQLRYKIDFFYDEAFENPVASYNSYPVLGNKETATRITDENLQSISEEVAEEDQNTIYLRVTFDDPERLELLERVRSLDRYSSLSGLTFSVYQQGLNDQLNLPLTKQSDGVYSGSFIVEEDDTVVNVDGLAVILISVPGQCNPISVADQNERLLRLLSPQNLDQSISILNNLDLFIENYSEDDVRGSFGNPAYYKKNRFGVDNRGKEDIGETGGNSQWAGGGDGSLETPPEG